MVCFLRTPRLVYRDYTRLPISFILLPGLLRLSFGEAGFRLARAGRIRNLFCPARIPAESSHPMKLNPNALLRVVCTAISFLPFFCLQAEGESATCESLAQFKIDRGEVNSAQAVPAGPLTVNGLLSTRTISVPAFCRVFATLRPTADSDIRIEVWLPASHWNGRMESVGNGGLAGSIAEDAMAGALWAGYATAGTDTGHTGSPATGLSDIRRRSSTSGDARFI
jgi:Tannase and feruloyl esterase